MDSPQLPRRSFLKAGGFAAGAAVLPATALSAEPAALAAKFQSRVTVALKLNGREVVAEVEPRTTVLDWLRESAGLTGTKKGCNEGACGACTVHLDGNRVNGCLTLLASCHGRELTTIEGLAKADGTLHPVQAAFIAKDAFQCGYCTSGQVMSAVACIREGHAKDPAMVREWMSGNLCRCAAYPQIAEAVLEAEASQGGA